MTEIVIKAKAPPEKPEGSLKRSNSVFGLSSLARQITDQECCLQDMKVQISSQNLIIDTQQKALEKLVLELTNASGIIEEQKDLLKQIVEG